MKQFCTIELIHELMYKINCIILLITEGGMDYALP